MMKILGMPLDKALLKLADEGVSSVVSYTFGRREAEDGEARVVRLADNGWHVTAARFPTQVRRLEEEE